MKVGGDRSEKRFRKNAGNRIWSVFKLRLFWLAQMVKSRVSQKNGETRETPCAERHDY